jgi:hypothetical protein
VKQLEIESDEMQEQVRKVGLTTAEKIALHFSKKILEAHKQ